MKRETLQKYLKIWIDMENDFIKSSK